MKPVLNRLSAIGGSIVPNSGAVRRRGALTGLALAAPVLAGCLVFFALPFGLTLRYSFTFGAGGGRFVGLQNYGKVLASPAFRLAAANTLRFLAVGLPLIMALGLCLALLLRQRLAGASAVCSVLLLPMVVPVAGIVMLLQVMFAERGVVNGALNALGLPLRAWLNGPAAFWVLMGLYLWKNCGYNVVLLLAGMNMIPDELYQNAALDGANAWQRFWSITLPLITPSLFFVFVLSVINSFKTYREAFLLGGNYPADSIYFLQHFLNNNFQNLNYQRLSVAAILLFCLIFGLVAALYRLQLKNGGETAL